MRAIPLILALLLSVGAALQAQKPVSDDHLYDQVRLRLAQDADLGTARVEVAVKDGVVTLRGTVELPKYRSKAERIASKVKGVRKVVNELKTARQQ